MVVKKEEMVVKETGLEEMMMGAKLTSPYLFSLDYCLFCPYQIL